MASITNKEKEDEIIFTKNSSAYEVTNIIINRIKNNFNYSYT